MCRTLLKLMLAVIMVGSLAMLAGCSANTEGGAILLGAAEEIDGEAGTDVDVDGEEGEPGVECPDCICDCGDDCCDGGDITVTCDCEATATAECDCCDCCDCCEPRRFCGDTFIDYDLGEECEKDNNLCERDEWCDEKTCLCMPLPVCGNGILEDGEECEEKADCGVIANFECFNCKCIVPVCGNEILEPGEECEFDDDCDQDFFCSEYCECLSIPK